MRINKISFNSFKGYDERAQFRKDAAETLCEIKNLMTCQADYATAQGDKPSVRSRLKKLLFIDSKKVGANYATQYDEKLLSKLKKQYVILEENEDFFEGRKYKDRNLDVMEIEF